MKKKEPPSTTDVLVGTRESLALEIEQRLMRRKSREGLDEQIRRADRRLMEKAKSLLGLPW